MMDDGRADGDAGSAVLQLRPGAARPGRSPAAVDRPVRRSVACASAVLAPSVTCPVSNLQCDDPLLRRSFGFQSGTMPMRSSASSEGFLGGFEAVAARRAEGAEGDRTARPR